jgi:thiamine kinase-like enzyme
VHQEEQHRRILRTARRLRESEFLRPTGWACELAGRIESRRGAPVLWACHNDLLAANFIRDGAGLWIVDWEYGGMGDPYFDLANFAANMCLDEEGELELLAAYGANEHERLVLLRFMSDFREAMWAVVQQAISELGVDFRAYADEHFERLERATAEQRFHLALR